MVEVFCDVAAQQRKMRLYFDRIPHIGEHFVWQGRIYIISEVEHHPVFAPHEHPKATIVCDC